MFGNAKLFYPENFQNFQTAWHKWNDLKKEQREKENKSDKMVVIVIVVYKKIGKESEVCDQHHKVDEDFFAA